MSFGSRLANILLPASSTPSSPPSSPAAPRSGSSNHHGAAQASPDGQSLSPSSSFLEEDEYTEAEGGYRHPYRYCMLAGGVGGSTGDMLMHPLDTVKTRQQGDTHLPPKYTTMGSTYRTIWRQEGLFRGLYSGVTPALLGSFPGTVIFFGTYEWSKRAMLDGGLMPSLSYLAAGFVADLAASFVYVPSEVLKTRLQLQGRFNNPHFYSGYNYRSTWDATRTIIRTEGVSALFYGYKATIVRDLPFSALQFAFYEQNQTWAKQWVGHRDIGLGLEILTATSAGCLAGVMTCPLDVVKTRIQTAVHPSETTTPSLRAVAAEQASSVGRGGSHTTMPPSSSTKTSAAPLETSSVIRGLRLLYQQEGIAGWFRGVGPRALWTSVQSGTMLVCYQALLRQLAKRSTARSSEGNAVA